MRAGLTERLAFVEDTTTKDPGGGDVVTTATLATLWGRVTALSGREALSAGAMESRVSARVVVRQGLLEAAAVSVSSITRSGATATVTTGAVHGLQTGEYARIAGAAQGDYNGRFVVTVSSTTVFTITVANSPTTPATGTITSTRLRRISAGKMRITWTPSWNAAEAARTLQILAVRESETEPRRVLELDCEEVT